MVGVLKSTLDEKGIRLRDESELQDLLAEPIVKFVLAVLRLGTRPRDPEAWEIVTTEIAAILGFRDEDDAPHVRHHCRELIAEARTWSEHHPDFTGLPSSLVNKVGPRRIKTLYRQYATGAYLTNILDKLGELLSTGTEDSNCLRAAVDDLIGLDVAPAMTIHKSKGLEFHTVIFLGLEDSQWWNFSNQPDEEKRGFFVAFSRAANRVYFTSCDFRDTPWGRKRQRTIAIGDLYEILRNAGVSTEDRRTSR